MRSAHHLTQWYNVISRQLSQHAQSACHHFLDCYSLGHNHILLTWFGNPDRSSTAKIFCRRQSNQVLSTPQHRCPDKAGPAKPLCQSVLCLVGTTCHLICRAFIIERLAKQRPGKGKDLNILFFGSRRRDRDYLYGDQLDGWAQEGAITLHTAFSREQVWQAMRGISPQDSVVLGDTLCWHWDRDGSSHGAQARTSIAAGQCAGPHQNVC